MTIEFQQANLFELSGDSIQVTYLTSGSEGVPLLSYRDGSLNRQFSGEKIKSVQTEIGELLTVEIEQIPEMRVVTFSLILPVVNVMPGTVGTHIQVLGITAVTYTNMTGEVLGQGKTYSQVNLTGTAQAISS